jgi:multiple antibiotic resistance protein
MTEQLQAIVTILSLVNPAICAAIFSQLETGRSSAAKLADALQAAVAILVILSLAALFGAKVLQMFGVSLDAFSVAGGFVLAWMGFSMLKGEATDSAASANDPSTQNPSLTPLILFAASPGTITGVITLAVAHSRTGIPVTALAAIGVTVAVTVGVMLMLSFFGGKQQGGFVHDTVTRFMGLIVIAMGVQFALTGLKAFMA